MSRNRGGGYNGHPSWRLWNLALWFANDEALYRLALDAIASCKTKDEAARYLVRCLVKDGGVAATPDGARYTVSGVRYALRGLS